MTLFNPWAVLAILSGPPLFVAAEILALAAMSKQAREVILVVEAVLLVILIPELA